MMSKWAQLSSNLPNDQIEEDGEIIRFGGQGACAAITETLVSMGFEVERPIEAGLNGWELYPKKGKLKLWLQITDFDQGNYLLGVRELKLFNSDRRRRRFASEVLVPFNEELRKNDKFSSVAWIDPNNVLEGGGAYSPTDPSVPEK
jgi:hypothetical protein